MTARPFEPGNVVAMKHGATSPSRFLPLAEELRAQVVEVAPWVGRPAFRYALEAWSIVEAKARLVDAWLGEHGQLTGKGGPRVAAHYADSLHGRARTLRVELGLSAQSFAKLLASFSAGVPTGDDTLARLRAEGAAVVAARDIGGALPPADEEHDQ